MTSDFFMGLVAEMVETMFIMHRAYGPTISRPRDATSSKL